jgi:hypothetical protein
MHPTQKRDEPRTRHASPATKCDTALKPARDGAGVSHNSCLRFGEKQLIARKVR